MTNERTTDVKKSRKEFFNLGLYLEALKRIRLPGIILTVILTLEAILSPLGLAVGYLMNKMMAARDNYEFHYSAEVLSGSELHMFLFLVAVVGAPIFAWVLFSFLNKRNASDFYHSLPHTRVALYVSNTAALLTWILGIIIVTSGISRLTAALFPKVLTVESGTYLPYMAGIFAVSLLVSACIIVGKTLTGTIFSNLTVTALIMFFPRFVLSLVTSAVTLKLPVVPADHVSFFLSPKLNIIMGVLSNYLGLRYDEVPCIYELSSQIYTIAIAVIYLVLGAVLFHLRKSETAQRPAPGRFMQAIYRIIIAFAVSVPFCYSIFAYEFDEVTILFLYVLMFLLSALAYFIYEIITTRRWKNLVRAIPTFLVVIALDAALMCTMHGIVTVEGAFRPEAGDIEYVQLVSNSYGNQMYSMDFKEYVTSETSKMKLTDKKAIETFASCLDETFEYLEEYGGIDDYYSITSGYAEVKDPTTICTFRIKTKSGITKYRNVRLHADDMTVITEAYKEMPGYVEMWKTLPVAFTGTVSIDMGAISISMEQAEATLEVFRRELAGVDVDKWIDFNTGYESGDAWFFYQAKDIYLSVPVSAELFPKTMAAMMKYANENMKADFKEVEKLMEEYPAFEIQFIDIWVYEDGMYQCYNPSDTFFAEDRDEFVFNSIDESELKYGDTFVRMDLAFYSDPENFDVTKEDGDYISCIVKISENSIPTLMEYFD